MQCISSSIRMHNIPHTHKHTHTCQCPESDSFAAALGPSIAAPGSDNTHISASEHVVRNRSVWRGNKLGNQNKGVTKGEASMLASKRVASHGTRGQSSARDWGERLSRSRMNHIEVSMCSIIQTGAIARVCVCVIGR